MTTYSVGYNQPGYLPEAEPHETTDFEEAKAVLIEAVKLEAEANAESGLYLAARYLDAFVHTIETWDPTHPVHLRAGVWGSIISGTSWWIEVIEP